MIHELGRVGDFHAQGPPQNTEHPLFRLPAHPTLQQAVRIFAKRKRVFWLPSARFYGGGSRLSKFLCHQFELLGGRVPGGETQQISLRVNPTVKDTLPLPGHVNGRLTI